MPGLDLVEVRPARRLEGLRGKVAGDHEEAHRAAAAAAGRRVFEQLILAALGRVGVVDQQDEPRAMLQRVGDLVVEGGERGVLLASEEAVFLILLGLAAQDQDGLPLHVEVGVIVVLELQLAVVGRDAVAGEDERRSLNSPAPAEGQRLEVLLGLALEGRRRRPS